MNNQEKVLTAILQNAEMGTSAIKNIFPDVRDSALKTELRHQLSEYTKQNNVVNHQMSNLNIQGQGISPMTKVMSNMGIKMKIAKDNSTGHIAEMLIQGTNMGIIKINQALNSSQDSPSKLTSQAKDLLSKEQHYIDRLKNYL